MPKTVVSIGEALWDVFPDARRPGGAPCNVAFHVARLGDRGAIVTRVGRDGDGDDLVTFLRERGVETGFVQRDQSRPTGTVFVRFEHADPHYTITEDVAWDYIEADDRTRSLARTADAVCVSTLAQRHEVSRTAIHSLLSAAHGRALIVFDVNLRPPFTDAETIDTTFRLADIVKMNESEVSIVSTSLGRPALIAWLLERVGVQAVCVTRGRAGASLTTLGGTVTVPGLDLDTTDGDPVGAGDAFVAALAHQLVHDATPDHALRSANRYAALVATKRGAMPPLSANELAEFGS